MSEKEKISDTIDVDNESPAREKNRPIPMRAKVFCALVIVLVILMIAFAIGVTIKTINYNKNKFVITIDPIVVSPQGENHINSAQIYTLASRFDSKEYTSNIEVGLTHNQYFVYKCTFSNNCDKYFNAQLSVNTQMLQNTLISYSIEDGAETAYIDKLDDIIISPNGKLLVYIYVRIDNPDDNAYVLGTMTISIAQSDEVA